LAIISMHMIVVAYSIDRQSSPLQKSVKISPHKDTRIPDRQMEIFVILFAPGYSVLTRHDSRVFNVTNSCISTMSFQLQCKQEG
jgi:hypothetical protein